jgi:zinc protease
MRTKQQEKLANKLAGSTPSSIVYEQSHPFGDAQVERWRLASGLTVLLLVDKSAPVVSYSTWYRVGSRHEKAGKTGLAHFFEHLMFNETEHLKAGEFDRKLEESGAESNAATWFDWTYYYEALPKDRLGLAVKLESDRMAHLVLRDKQVESEREVVSNERRFRVDDDVEGAANEELYKLAFTVHPYSWPTIGWMKDIEGYTPADCQAFYKTYYAPNNATVIVVGDFSEAAVLTKIQEAYAPIAAANIPPEDTHPEPPQLEERRLVLKKPTPTEKILIGYRGPALGDADHAPLSLLSEILFAGRASRLYKRLVTELELVSDLRGWVSTFRDPGLFEMYFTTREGHTSAEVEAVLDEELARVCTDVVSDAELDRAKARLELSTLQGLETAAGKAEQIGFYETVLGDPSGVMRRLEALRNVTSGQVRTVARRTLDKRSRSVVIVLPNGAEQAS